MHSALSRLQVIHVAWIKREVRASIMQEYTCITSDNTATKTIVEALNQRNDIALRILNADASGIALGNVRVANFDFVAVDGMDEAALGIRDGRLVLSVPEDPLR